MLNWGERLVVQSGLASEGEEASGQAKVVLSKLSPSLLLELQARADVLTGQFLVWFELVDPEQLLATTHFIEFYNQHLRRYSQGRVGLLTMKDIFSLLQEPQVLSATALSSTQVSSQTYKYWHQRLSSATGVDCASTLRDP